MIKLKKIFCVFLSCVVLLFGCYFLPKQRAEASITLAVCGTVAGLCALGMLLYGVCTTPEEVPSDVVDNMCGVMGWLDNPTQGLALAAVDASLYLAASSESAQYCYSSGFCGTVIQGPLPNFVSRLPSGFPFFSFPSTAFANGSVSFGLGDGVQSNSIIFYSNCAGFPIYPYFCTTNQRLYFIFNVPSAEVQHNGIGNAILCCGGFININYNWTSEFTYNNQYYIYGDTGYSWATNAINIFSYNGINIPSFSLSPEHFVEQYVSSGISADVKAKPVISGACDVFNGSKSLDSYHVDSPGNDVLDIGNLLEKTGCDTVDDVVTKVYNGELSAQDVFDGLQTQPYVDVDVDTGTIAIPGETTNSRPVALDKDLSIPSDIANTDTYVPANPSDSSSLPNGKFTFPLSKFFPFCLPWDIYKVLKVFNSEPVAPVITIPTGSFFSDISGVDDRTTEYQTVIDLGDDQFSKWFLLLRNLEKIGILIGFVIISRFLIHGGD